MLVYNRCYFKNFIGSRARRGTRKTQEQGQGEAQRRPSEESEKRQKEVTGKRARTPKRNTGGEAHGQVREVAQGMHRAEIEKPEGQGGCCESGCDP